MTSTKPSQSPLPCRLAWSGRDPLLYNSAVTVNLAVVSALQVITEILKIIVDCVFSLLHCEMIGEQP